MLVRGVLALSALALAAGSAAAAEKAKSSRSDPNRVVCKTISESGSRLKKSRVCHTNAEWAELRRQTKEEIDQIQNNRPASGQ